MTIISRWYGSVGSAPLGCGGGEARGDGVTRTVWVATLGGDDDSRCYQRPHKTEARGCDRPGEIREFRSL